MLTVKNLRMICGHASLLLLAIPAVPQQPEPAKKTPETTITGCLNKGERENHYTFTDLKTGRNMTVTGPADLQKHASNHTVKITGSRTSDVFNVTKVEHVSPTCQATASK